MGKDREYVSLMAPIASCHLKSRHLKSLCEIPDATDGFDRRKTGFEAVTLLKVTGGLMDRCTLPNTP